LIHTSKKQSPSETQKEVIVLIFYDSTKAQLLQCTEHSYQVTLIRTDRFAGKFIIKR